MHLKSLVRLSSRCAATRENLSGFWLSMTQTYLLSYKDYLEYWIFVRSKLYYYTLNKVNNKGADYTVQMRRPVCLCCSLQQSKVFLASMPSCRYGQAYDVLVPIAHVSCVCSTSLTRRPRPNNTHQKGYIHAYIVTISIKISGLPWPLFW